MSGAQRPPYPALWCGQHERWERTEAACDCAFDPEEVDWLVTEEA